MHHSTKELLNEEEYLAREESAGYKSEFLAGEVFAMSGASTKHNVVASNMNRALGNLLADKPRIVLTSDQRVYVEASGLYTYPDVVIVCDRPRYHTKSAKSLTNPTAIVEVLSPSTEAYDRGAKFEHYRMIDSLQEYVLVTPGRLLVEHYAREAGGSWTLRTFMSDEASVPFPTLGIAVLVRDIYAKVDLVPGDDDAAPRPPRPKRLR